MTRRAMMLAGLLGLAACGFTPVYGPGGGGQALQGAVALPVAKNDAQYAFNQRFEDRLGRASSGAPYVLKMQFQKSDQDLGSTSTGSTTRIRLIGRVFFTLSDAGTGAVLRDARTNAFVGYSTTGSTVATRAAERDAEERLMVLLADQVIDDLLLHAPDFAAGDLAAR